MDRFERYKLTICQKLQKQNLHSNMDRFERYVDAGNILDDIHLHSNMDRFESGIVSEIKARHDKIYIPIWIDLKVV